MNLSEIWISENIVEQKYLEHLKKIYPIHELEKLLNLNIDLRLLYLKHIFIIENSLKNVLLHQLFIDELQNLNNSHYINQEHLRNLKLARRIIRYGYHKYTRNGILKSKTIRCLIEVMSFEAIMNLLQTLTNDNLIKIASYFGIIEFNSPEILINKLTLIKDTRNYLSHNFKVLGINFNYKHNNNEQQDWNANNDLNYLHKIINQFSSKNQLLPIFTQEYNKLFESYDVSNNGAK